jgi:hypothetical protein
MTYTAKQLIVAVGQTVNVKVEKWTVPMVVKDAKTAYGVPRILVEPVDGEGAAWVDLGRVSVPHGTLVELSK